MTDILVAPDGTIRFIHEDRLTEQMQHAGPTTVRRASYVEPETAPPGTMVYEWRFGLGPREGQMFGTRDMRNSRVVWVSNMAPVGGPRLGPFASREFALSEERRWLEENNIPTCRTCGEEA